MSNLCSDDEYSAASSSEIYDRYTPTEKNKLRTLFHSLTIEPTASKRQKKQNQYREPNPQRNNTPPTPITPSLTSRLSSLQLEDPIAALDVGIIQINDGGNSSTPSSEDKIPSSSPPSQQIIATITLQLKKTLQLGSGPYVDDMYEEMARSMLRCRIRMSQSYHPPPSVVTNKTADEDTDPVSTSCSTSENGSSDEADTDDWNRRTTFVVDENGSTDVSDVNYGRRKELYAAAVAAARFQGSCDDTTARRFYNSEEESGLELGVSETGSGSQESVREERGGREFIGAVESESVGRSESEEFKEVEALGSDGFASASGSVSQDGEEVQPPKRSGSYPPPPPQPVETMLSGASSKDNGATFDDFPSPPPRADDEAEFFSSSTSDTASPTSTRKTTVTTAIPVNEGDIEDGDVGHNPPSPGKSPFRRAFNFFDFEKSQFNNDPLTIPTKSKSHDDEEQDDEPTLSSLDDAQNPSPVRPTPHKLDKTLGLEDSAEPSHTPLPESPAAASNFAAQFASGAAFNVDLKPSPTSKRRPNKPRRQRRLPNAPYPPNSNPTLSNPSSPSSLPDVEMSTQPPPPVEPQPSPSTFAKNVDDAIAQALSRATSSLPAFNVDLTPTHTSSSKPRRSRTRPAPPQQSQISSLRSDGRTSYMNGDYKSSVLSYTSAIALSHPDASGRNDTLAILHGNRAAALMMLGAFDAAASDCSRALEHVRDEMTFIPEGGAALKAKLYCRMARAYLKAGRGDEAERGFGTAVAVSREALDLANRGGMDANDTAGQQAVKVLKQTLTDGELGRSDVERFREAVRQAATVATSAKKNYNQVLIYLNNALAMSPGCVDLHLKKVTLLSQMRRWSELARHCERVACESVKLDGVFTRDLRPLDPHQGVSPAKALQADFFEEKSGTCLSVSEVCDAVVRLPREVLPLYMRAMRLEERYSEAARAGTALEVLATTTSTTSPNNNNTATDNAFAWLSDERDKLRRTRTGKERGDLLFRCRDYKRAAEKYAECLSIDGENTVAHEKFDNAGGRLHAILHCNRAACLMALEEYKTAVKECSAALKIQSQYMKAILRRARCHAKLEEYQESMADFQKWIKLVEDAKKGGKRSGGTCWFDRASDVKEGDEEKVRKELDDVKRSMKEKVRRVQKEAEVRAQKEKLFSEKYKDGFQKKGRGEWWRDGSAGRTRRTTPRSSSARNFNFDDSSGSSGGGGRTERDKERSGSRNSSRKILSPKPCPNTECHYKVLKLTMRSSTVEIKKSYHKMALRYHPDKNKEPEAADIFRRIQAAYEILSDDEARRKYDAEVRLKQFSYL